MAAAERGIVAQIIALRADEARKKTLAEREGLQKLEAALRDERELKLSKAQALDQSFLILKPEVEQLLQEIADTYTDPNGNPLVQPKVETFTPESVYQPGHFALIWGTAQTTDFGTRAIDDFTKANDLLTSSKKLSKRKIRQLTDYVNELGQTTITISGFNTVIFVADTEEGISRKLMPVLYLQGTGIPRTRIQAWYDNTRITETFPPIAPILSKALAQPTNQGIVPSSVAEFVTVGAKNIRPTGPFV